MGKTMTHNFEFKQAICGESARRPINRRVETESKNNIWISATNQARKVKWLIMMFAALTRKNPCSKDIPNNIRGIQAIIEADWWTVTNRKPSKGGKLCIELDKNIVGSDTPCTHDDSQSSKSLGCKPPITGIYLHQSSIYPVFYPALIPVSLLLKNTTVWLAPDFGWPKLHCSRVKDAKAGRAGLVFFFFRMVVEIIDFLRPE